jgi:hypothetical protein
VAGKGHPRVVSKTQRLHLILGTGLQGPAQHPVPDSPHKPHLSLRSCLRGRLRPIARPHPSPRPLLHKSRPPPKAPLFPQDHLARRPCPHLLHTTQLLH